MTETPREYKQRIDKKRAKNEKNKNELIKKIDEYELLDQNYKTVTKQKILENFSKNQKAEQESEQYITIISELSKIDQKYEELNQLEEKLNLKKEEKEKTEKEIREIKWDGVDETTLMMQRAGFETMKGKIKALISEIEELEKDIQNRKAEIKEIEGAYGEISKNDMPTEDLSKETSKSTQSKFSDITPSTLKNYHEQTVKDLRIKDKIVGEIWRLLDEGTGIDEELKNRIKNDVSKRFSEYYDEKQGTLRMKSARYLKNKLNNIKNEYEEILKMPDGPEKERRIEKLDRLLMAYPLSKPLEGIEEIILGRAKENTKKILKQYHEARKTNRLINNWEDKEKVIKASEKIPVKIDVDKDGSRLIEFMIGNKLYKILDPTLNNYRSKDYSYIPGTRKGRNEMIMPTNRRHFLLEGMRGNDVDKWKNEPLRKYVKQKENEGLHIASLQEIQELLNNLGGIIGSTNNKDKMAMLMYLTGLDGGYWLGEVAGYDRAGAFFNGNHIDFKRCGDRWRLNLLMMSVTEL